MLQMQVFLLGTFVSVFQGGTWRIQDLPHFPFGICTHAHTGAYRDRQSGGTDLALAELGASECPLFSTCFTLQNKVPAPIKQGHLASRHITVVHDMCINICSRWVCLPWLTDVLMVHYCVKQIRNSTLALYSNLIKMSSKRASLDMFHNFDMHCNLQVTLGSSGCWNVVLCKSQFVCTGS